MRFVDLADGGRQLSALIPAELVADCLVVFVPPDGEHVAAALGDVLDLLSEPLAVTTTDAGVAVEVPLDVRGRRVLVVDVGVETGTAARAVVAALRDAGASYVALAVPVCPREAEADLRRRYDDVIAVTKPLARRSLRWHYDTFA